MKWNAIVGAFASILVVHASAAPVVTRAGAADNTRVKLDNGREVSLVIPSDLAAQLAERTTEKWDEVATVTPEDRQQATDAMRKVVDDLKRDTTTLALLAPTLTTTDAQQARLVDVAAPSYKFFDATGALPKRPAQTKALVNYNLAYLRAQTGWKSAVADVTKNITEFFHASDAAQQAIGATAAAATSAAQRSDDAFFAALAVAAKLKIERDSVERRARDLQQKVTYGADDVFLPEDYEGMLKNLPRVVGFYGSGPLDLIGVGVLVGPGAVLTCHHVVADPRFATATARSRSKPDLPAEDCAFTITGVVFDPDAAQLPADLALVAVRQTAGPTDVATDDLAIDPAPPRNWPIYVLAMHRRDVRSLAVYDSAAVLFPATVKGRDLPALYADAILGLGVRIIAHDLTLEQATQLREDLEQCYGVTIGNAVANQDYAYRRTLQDGVRNQVFGFGTDTVEGNSGGGVFSKTTGRLVGLISSGVAGNGVERTADWSKHEVGVPGEVIRTFLEHYRQAAARNQALPALHVVFP